MRVERVVTGLALAGLAVWMGTAWTRAFRLRERVKDAPYAAFFAGGLVADVRAIQEEGADPVYVPTAVFTDYAVQRLSEMLYPVRVIPWSGPNAAPGLMLGGGP